MTAVRQPLRSVAPTLRQRNPMLFRVATVHAVLFAVFLVGIPLDPRTVGGEPVWLKPAKFAGSIALFTGTLGWLSAHLPAPERTIRRVSLGLAITMFGEITLIGGQAARGVESHFNGSTTLNTVVYLLMGLLIFSTVLLILWLLARSWRGPYDVSPAFAWGIRLGILVFVLAGLEGGVMIALGTSVVGSGAEVPFVGWNLGGDFRIAHFLGLHALQVLPLVGYLASVGDRRGRLARPLPIVAGVAAGFAAIFAGLFGHALAAA